MSSDLEETLVKLDKLSFDELLTLQEQLTLQLRAKKQPEEAPKIEPLPNEQPSHYVKIPGAYQPTKEQIEARLAAIFTTEELARIKPFDASKLRPLPPDAKSLSEIVNEDREDRV